MQILVVCTGNICRSPMGEIVLREALRRAGRADIAVSSAGVSAEEDGHGIDHRAQNALVKGGYTLPSHHRAHRVIDAELRESDLVLAMTVGHARALRRRLQDLELSAEKLHLWREFDGTLPVAEAGCFGTGGALWEGVVPGGYSDFYSSEGDFDVPDPWYGGQEGFYRTLAVCEAGAAGVVEWLEKKSK